MKVRVLKEFIDKNTRELHRIEDIVEYPLERGQELIDGEWVEELATDPEDKETGKKPAVEKEATVEEEPSVEEEATVEEEPAVEKEATVEEKETVEEEPVLKQAPKKSNSRKSRGSTK